uniref:Uncharacterized protein AlNc14C12G1428 n=1 Tax=Albugo laibachii Nc14 TaxID=890382 RepID=F0W350_9STRA|nr:conserved hypothetical protein [Albugo laibachii Nc14]|eukprot:CCA15490.1 conserved hypothetical protein [Albugo laibachii Nc14]
MSLAVDEINNFSSSHSKEQTWWRWTHGESGSISSSSENLASTFHSDVGSDTTLDASKHSLYMENAGPRSSPGTAIRWQKRAPRTNCILKDNGAFPPSVWTSNHQKSLTSSPHNSCAAPVNGMAHPMRSKTECSSHLNDMRKRNVPIHHIATDSVESCAGEKAGFIGGCPKNDESLRQPCSDIKWSLGTSTRRTCKKDKRNFRNSIVRPTEQSSRYRSAEIRSEAKSKPPISERQPVFQSFRRMDSSNCVRDIQRYGGTGQSNVRGWKGDTLGVPLSSSSSSAPAETANMMDCSEEVLKDCIQQNSKEGNIRKRTLEGYAKADLLEGKGQHPDFHIHNKSLESHCSTCCSSDDELNQLSAMEPSILRLEQEKSELEEALGVKSSRQIFYRGFMLNESDFGTSPDYERSSPNFEEKGLPVEIRYQLPLALGTANETEKECTICQLLYGIGDHIVTLPCEHFFHACCLDKWLWNHTSCPLCRTEVSLSENGNSKHQFNECSLADQQNIRRIMRSSSHTAGFRPVVPADSTNEQLDQQIAQLSMQDDTKEDSQIKYLVCPTPRRNGITHDQS